ncbi:MAG: hypothetical protein FWE16_03365 [Firmicutes bacterium]|nr:hypothetical protein [Bacillota bacterium]
MDKKKNFSGRQISSVVNKYHKPSVSKHDDLLKNPLSNTDALMRSFNGWQFLFTQRGYSEQTILDQEALEIAIREIIEDDSDREIQISGTARFFFEKAKILFEYCKENNKMAAAFTNPNLRKAYKAYTLLAKQHKDLLKRPHRHSSWDRTIR